MLHCPFCNAAQGLFRDPFCRTCGAHLAEIHDAEIEETDEDRAEKTDREATISAFIGSIVFYGFLTFPTFSPRFAPMMRRTFGPEPLGMKPENLGRLVLTVLFIPIPFAFYHLGLIREQQKRDGFMIPGSSKADELGFLMYLSDLHIKHPELSRSRGIVIAAVVYVVGLVVAWIVYAAKLGI